MDEVSVRSTAADETEGLDYSSKAVFDALNPEQKSKLGKKEVLEHFKNVEGNDEKAMKHFSEAARKALMNRHVKKIINKVICHKDGKSLKESDMVAINKRFMAGHLPRIRRDPNAPSSSEDEKSSEGDDDNDGEEEKVEKKGMLHQVLGYSLKSAMKIKNYMEKVVSKAGMSWLLTVLPVGQITTLVTFVLFSYVITAPFLGWFIPLFLLGFSMSIMVVSTMRIVRGVKRFAEFKAWAEFLDTISDTQPEAIDTSKAEENYILNHVSPYIQFLISCCFCVMAHSVSDKDWVFNAELGLLSLMMFGTIVVVHDMQKSKASIGIYACQIFATVLEGFHRMEGSVVFGQLFAVNLPFTGVAVNVNLPGVLRLWMVLQIASLLQRKSYKNFSVNVIKEVLPHVIAAAWWEVAIMFLGVCSIQSIIRASAECVALLFAMPLLFLALVLGVLNFIVSLELTKIFLLAGAFALAAVYLKIWKSAGLLSALGKLKAAKALKPVLKLLALIAFGGMVFFYRPSGLSVPDSGLTWNDYKAVCLSDAPPEANGALKTLVCNEFNGYGVRWKGTASDVRVVSVTNEVERFVNVLPHSAASWLSCAYGAPYPTAEECKELKTAHNADKIETALCELLPHTKRRCHLQKYNQYKFQIQVSIPSELGDDDHPSIITLDAGHDFRKVLFGLKKGSPIEFIGTIKSRMMLSVKALFTKTESKTMMRHSRRAKRIENTLATMMDEAFDSLCRFIFYPIITFPEGDEEEE